jgi:hypothetical protein
MSGSLAICDRSVSVAGIEPPPFDLADMSEVWESSDPFPVRKVGTKCSDKLRLYCCFRPGSLQQQQPNTAIK